MIDLDLRWRYEVIKNGEVVAIFFDREEAEEYVKWKYPDAKIGEDVEIRDTV